ncbi:prenyltransferase/squalene oxidase repeat-containing protein [Actinomadura nitritigenes]|uniref:prenyltransferase/squalene oxidase repeat-containing protein n=1 Tax=Actinomadura nitritigenes TaxID=134602 RepID=UPI003D92291B
MSVDDRPIAGTTLPSPRQETTRPSHEPDPDLPRAAARLIDGLTEHPWGRTSPSVYETGRLVTLAPWLSGHERRVSYLLERQRPDGMWGAPEPGYALVPTLSATEALLKVITREGGVDGAGRDRLARAADLALGAAAARLCGPSAPAFALPDLPAIELITPALLEGINASLDRLRDAPVTGLGAWAGRRLDPPPGIDGTKLGLVRALLVSGAPAPQKLMHALEVAGPAAAGLPHARPEPTGTIGASPAATAAWLGAETPPEPGDPARWFLETVVARHGGPVPCGIPLTVFERGWVLAWLARAGVPLTVPPELVLSLTAPLGPAGTAAAAGLPSDADTTAGALYALALLDAPCRPDSLLPYETETHFCTWQGEDGASITTNAHVLEAFGQYLATMRNRVGAASAERYAAAAAKAASWLCKQQRKDGDWEDRWHASPYYATACAAIALAAFGGERSAGAVAAARRWVLATQRADGSWGRWEGTAEETAYAVQLLLLTGSGSDAAAAAAAARARPHLLRGLTSADEQADQEPALWHDKDLYRPGAIVRAGIVAAFHLGRGSGVFR